MRQIVKLILLFTLLVLGLCVQQSSAQCIDSNRVYPTAPCPTEYKPVCACGITYRNDCYALYRGGVIGTMYEGPCSGFDFDVFPNFVTELDNVTITFVQNTGLPADFVVVDWYGKIVVQRTLPARDQFVNSINFQLDVTYFTPGTYIALMYNSKGTYRYKKFVKI